MTDPCSAPVRFGVFDFDVAALQLRKKGRLVRVRPQALRLLALIIARPGALVSRDEIRAALWGDDTFVDFDQGVNHCIKELRLALRDDAGSPRYIETLPRRGYRFIAPIERIDEPAAVAASPPVEVAADQEVLTAAPPARLARRPLAIATAAIAAVALAAGGMWQYGRWNHPAPGPASVVVQVRPFVSRPDPSLGVGLSREVTRRLSGQPGLAVSTADRSPASAAAVSDGATARDTRALFLDADLEQSGGEVRCSPRLVDSRTGAVVWSQHFTVRADELFSVEDVVAERVVAALRLRVAAADQDRLRRRYTNNAPAYADYLRGRAALAEYTPQGTRRAVEAFSTALQHQPDFTLARAGLAAAFADLYLRFAPPGDPDRFSERAEAEARAALDADPDLAEAHLARAAVARKREFDWQTAIAASRRALVLNPTLDQAHFFIAAAYYHLGYMEEAQIEAERGRALNGPDQVEPLRIEALVALFSGRFAPAVAHLEEVSRRSSQPIGDTYLALAYYYTGNTDRAVRMLTALASHPSASTAARAGAALAGVQAARGDLAAARTTMRRVLAQEYRDHHVAYGLGVANARLGDEPAAIEWLRTAADTGFPCVVWFERDPLLAPIRGRAPFTGLLDHVRALRESTAGR